MTEQELKSLDSNGVYLSIEDAKNLKFNNISKDSLLLLNKNSINTGCYYQIRYDSSSQFYVKDFVFNPKYRTENNLFYLKNDSVKINEYINFIGTGINLETLKVYSSEDNYKSPFDSKKVSNNERIFFKNCEKKGVFKILANTNLTGESSEIMYNYQVY